MTETLSRPPGQRGPKRPPGREVGVTERPVTVAGAVAACRAAGLGLLGVMVLVLVGWATAADSQASATSAVSAGMLVWLVGHGSHVVLDGGSFTLVPLGLAAVMAALLWSATARAARETKVRDTRGIVSLVSAVASTYAVLSVLVGLLERTGGPRVSLVSAFAGAALMAGMVATAATLRVSGRDVAIWHRLPGLVRDTAPASAAAVAVLFGGGAAVAGLALAGHGDQARSLAGALETGAGGAVFLGLGSLAALPNAAVWATGFAVGPGFAVGADTSVAITGSELGAVPAVPLLAALPTGPDTGAGWLAALVPLAAGVLAGFLVRRARPADGWSGAGALADLRAAAVVGGVTGGCLAMLAALSAGSAGPGRMSEVGPTWWAIGLAVGLEMSALAAVTLLALRRR